MLNSLKAKIIIPVVVGLTLLVTVIIVFVSISMRTLYESLYTYTEETLAVMASMQRTLIIIGAVSLATVTSASYSVA